MTQHVLWAARLVAVSAAVASVHGMHAAVAVTAIGWWLAWLWPVMTDGLAVVAWAATRQLRTGLARGYAWAVLLVSVAVSGLAQAVWLGDGGSLVVPQLARGIGGWPAVALIVTAHLVWLLARSGPTAETGLAVVTAQVETAVERPEPAPIDLDALDWSEPVADQVDQPADPPNPPDRTESDDVLAADLAAVAGSLDRPLSRREVIDRYRVGAGRADRLRSMVEQSGRALTGADR